MKPNAAAKPLFFAVLSFFSASPLASGQLQHQAGPWKDNAGRWRSLTDLEIVLSNHKRWLDSNSEAGAQAQFSYWDLSGAELWNANLRRARFSGATLFETNFSHADLGGADLSLAMLTRANLDGANLNRANLSGANLSSTSLHGTNLQKCGLDGR
jgi:uncharacterized protein YjbI with pentapeptide repeats